MTDPLTDPIPRSEYPRPQMYRPSWRCLNGTWDFEIDRGDSGLERGLLDRALQRQILVPFAPESASSGVGDTDFLEAVWYRRTEVIPAEWAGRRVLLHFGAVDHDCTVWVNGDEVTRHRGGFTSFTVDITHVVAAGEPAVITVRARDSRYAVQARGKQATWLTNSHCNYTRTTGIWQTVWLEAVPTVYLQRPRITPDLGSAAFTVAIPLSANQPGLMVRAVLSDDDGEVVQVVRPADLDLAPSLHLVVPVERLRVWRPQDPHLYGLRIDLLGSSGDTVDSIDCYAGMRSIAIVEKAVLLNGERVFQRLVLDQGYWSDSLMTAPTDQALIQDIELAMAAGFNGARLHQKVFEERFLFHADRLGYLCWAEFGDWGVSGQGPAGHNQQPTASFVAEWTEVLARDHNHPSIIGWCPMNETHQAIHDRITTLDDVTQAMFRVTKLADPSRPVIDASGYSHRVTDTDIYDAHSYEQDAAVFAASLAGLSRGEPYVNTTNNDALPMSVPYRGQPYFISEFGGIWWDPDAAAAGGDAGDDIEHSWGYGQVVDDEHEFYQRFTGLVAALADNHDMFGYCYTQLTDVFQEKNGLYRFDRSAKLDIGRIKAAQSSRAAFEQPA